MKQVKYTALQANLSQSTELRRVVGRNITLKQENIIMKKAVLIVVALIVLAAGALFVINGKSSYDPAKYHLRISPENSKFGKGSTIELTLPDQFGETQTLGEDIKTLIFVFTKATGHTIKAYLSDKKEDYLPKYKAAVVADISGMPVVIQNTFALPDFRKNKHIMMLIFDKEMAKKLKEGQKTDKVIVMKLDKRKVTDIKYISDKSELKNIIEHQE